MTFKEKAKNYDNESREKTISNYCRKDNERRW